MSDQQPVTAPDKNAFIGVFDSGLGGLSILRELMRRLPNEKLVYFADNLHVPYGSRPLAEIRGFSEKIAGNLLAIPCKMVIVACNTASAAALRHLRSVYPETHFVGMEPAVKPAAAHSSSRRVGVLATQATFQGELFESVVERFARGTEIMRQACPGLAEFIEAHPSDHPILKPMLEKFILPLRDAGIDQLVLACTHYPLVKDAIQEIAGPEVEVVDPSPAIAKRARQVLAETKTLSDGPGGVTFLASGDLEIFSRSASRILGQLVQARNAQYSV